MGIRLRLWISHLRQVDGNQLTELLFVNLVRLSCEKHPKDEKTSEVHSDAHEGLSHLLTDLLLLFCIHGAVHRGVILVVKVAFLCLAAEVVFELAESAHGIVLFASLLIRKCFVGLTDLLELALMTRVTVRVVLLGQFVVSFLDLRVRGVLGHSKNEVVIFGGIELGRLKETVLRFVGEQPHTSSAYYSCYHNYIFYIIFL